MFANVQPETKVWELIAQLDAFVRGYALEFMVGIILLTFFGGIWVLLWLRRWRKSAGSEANTGVVLVIGFGPERPTEEPPPLFESKVHCWDDLRD